MYETDIVIIGAGVIGSFIARELAKFRIRVMVVDKRLDVGGDASKANNGVLASSGLYPVGSVEAHVIGGSRTIFKQILNDLEVPYTTCGRLLPAFTQDELNRFPYLYDQCCRNSYYDAEILSAEQVRESEPNINPEVLGGFLLPNDGAIDPFQLVVALAENAAENGVEFLLNCEVKGINVHNGKVDFVETTQGTIKTRYVINSAGLYCDKIAKMVGECDFVVKPRKGQFYVLDKNTPVKVNHILAQVPTEISSGVMIIPQTHGNMCCGPTAENMEDKEDYSVDQAGLDKVAQAVLRMVPGLRLKDAITHYCGLRPNRIPEGINIVISQKAKGYVGISGVRSSGVSSSPAIARLVINKMIMEGGFEAERKFGDFNPKRKGIVSFRKASHEERQKLIES
ncbi:MAG: NAD(P)/FAD-dependent oxidoreductase, partial [Acetivibrionales bacterium]